MLIHLHVKNLALIEEAEVDFDPRLEYSDRRDGSRKVYSSRVHAVDFRQQNVKRNDS